MLKKLAKLAKQIRARYPSRLPVGVTEFHAWAESFSEIYDLPTQDVDSIKFMLGSSILNLGPTVHRKPKYFFYAMMNAAAAKQIAGSVFYEIKEKQKKAQAEPKEVKSEQ